MNMVVKSIVIIGFAAGLAACNAGASTFYQPLGNPLPPARVSSVGVSVPAQQLPVVTQPQGGNRPSVVINASPQKVQDTIIARARSRGTNVLGATRTGVTLEIPLKESSDVITNQCGPHTNNRTIRVYLETVPNGPGTTVSEDKFIIDGGTKVCTLVPTPADIEGSNKTLADLKQQSETARTASATRSSNPASNPAGGVSPVNPARPVVPLR